MYEIANCNIGFIETSEFFDNYEEAMAVYEKIVRQARRGLRPFPEFIDHTTGQH